MGRRKSKGAKWGRLTVDRSGRSGHYQGHGYSDVYRDGRAHVYTAWNDNDDDVGVEMPFEEWLKAYR